MYGLWAKNSDFKLPCDHGVPPEPVTAEMHRPSTGSHPVHDTGASSGIGSVSSDHVALGTSSPPPSPPSGLLPPPHQYDPRIFTEVTEVNNVIDSSLMDDGTAVRSPKLRRYKIRSADRCLLFRDW